MPSTPFYTVLNKYRKEAYSERDKGTKFERLMQAYLKTDPKYADRFKKVWMWSDFPSKGDLGGTETGIDLIALTVSGEYWAIQCKCFQEETVIDKPAVDSFLATSGRKFTDKETLKTAKFSHRLWISTSNNWGINAEEAIQNQEPPVSRINLCDLESAAVDWDKLDQGLIGEVSRTEKKFIRPDQVIAVDKAHEYFKKNERGKLIMACGTGKTYVSLKIAEKETKGKGLILFLMPSIALIGQALNEWYKEAEEKIEAICICSDAEVSKKKSKNEDSGGYSLVDLALPASTDVKDIVRQFDLIKDKKNKGLTVVFSTYQSIEVIAQAQSKLLKRADGDENPYGVFDLIICDEAHRTTGVKLADEDASAFIKVHDAKFIKAKRRMYMTATPRLYSDDSKAKAAEAEAILCSMDDERLYGEEIYRIGFGEAVEKNLLSDYKVLILTMSEADMPTTIQRVVAGTQSEISTDDASKLIGCINALSKKIVGDEGSIKATDPDPMRRAVAFCQSIKASKSINTAFLATNEAYYEKLSLNQREGLVNVSSDHIDGTMSAPKRDEKMSWLKGASEDSNECRVLTNVRCLSEGVDVPSLDAVLFLSPRNSQIDVVQSVGRVMRKAPGKKYGYIVIPIVVPAHIPPEQALDDNDRYKVVWTVLNALRAHDDRFNATVNKIELNKRKPGQILIGRPDFGDGKASDSSRDGIANQMAMEFEKLQGTVYAKMVQKVGDRRYWEQWASSVAEIAERSIERIGRLVKEEGDHKKAFEEFLGGLQKNINPSITQTEAIEMLSQHIITKPVFEALFEDYSFVKSNPISVSMQKMLDLIEAQTLEKDTESLKKFYESVKQRAKGIDNAEGRQRVIIELYDKFFKTAFPKVVEKLGIVYTPVEVVDFIIHSVQDVLKQEFNRSLSDENIHILDPFTGTGTFVTRLLESGLITPKALERKYTKEIHANEIVLLAYYIAAINIENSYHELVKDSNKYKAFDGICLTDTFQLGESDESTKLFAKAFPENSERVLAQKKTPIRIIMGNPPYSIGQKSENDNAQNQDYPALEARIAGTYASSSKAVSIKALYDSYIKAFRWSADRIDSKTGGIIAFVSNSNWLDSAGMDGFRKSLEKEFSKIYVFNLRGNCRTQGELRRKEAGNVFGLGSRTPIAITILVKNSNQNKDNAEIYYYDIGDYLSREEKLSVLKKYASIAMQEIEWQELYPNEQGDWLNLRDEMFYAYFPIEPEKKYDLTAKSVFSVYSNGVITSRDAWDYNYSRKELICNTGNMVSVYNDEIDKYVKATKSKKDVHIENDPKKISWSSSLRANFERGHKAVFESKKLKICTYRPFTKQFLYFGDKMVHRKGQFEDFFPFHDISNHIITISGIGANKEFSAFIADNYIDFQTMSNGQCFPLNYYEERKEGSKTLFDEEGEGDYIRRDGITDFILEQARKIYGNKVSKEDIFYYVYGFLHSPEYRTRFANDLKKSLPRIPLVNESKDFWAFSKAGRKLIGP